MPDSNEFSKTGFVTVEDVLKCAKKWREEIVKGLLFEHRRDLHEQLCTTLAAAPYSAPVSRTERAMVSMGEIAYEEGQISLVYMSMCELPSSSDLFDTQRKLLKAQAKVVDSAIAYLSTLIVSPTTTIEYLVSATSAAEVAISVNEVSAELSDALLRAGSLLAPAQLQMLRAEKAYSHRSVEGFTEMQRNVLALSAASAETSLWCLYVVPKLLEGEAGLYFPPTTGLSPRSTFVFAKGKREIKVTGDSPSSAVLLSSALASLYDAQAALAFGKTSLDEQGIHGYGRLALALQTTIKLIADADKSSQSSPLLVPLYLRLLWTSTLLFHISLDTFLTNKNLFVGSVFRATKLCLMLHAVAQKFLFGKQHGNLDAYVSMAWDALQVSSLSSGLPSSLILIQKTYFILLFSLVSVF